MTTAVAPANWTTSLNAATTDLLVDGSDYYVENADKSYSLTSPSSGVLQFEVKSGDVWTAVDPTTKNRSEIAGATTFLPGKQINVTYGFDLLPGSVNSSSWCVIGQFHQLKSDGNSPPFEIDMVGQKMAVQVDYLNSSGAEMYKTLYVDSQNIVEGHKYAMNIQVTFNANGTGHLVLIRDGVTLVNYTGAMGFAANPDVYWKEGIYRSASSSTMTAQYSNLHITTGAASTTGSTSTTSTLTVIGGHGNDTYVVTNSAEKIIVAAGTLNETVDASVSYVLPANIQNLVLKGSGLRGTANSMNDSLISTGGANTLVGGSGSDTFHVNNVGDKVVVGAVHGNDVIDSSVSYALPANVHNLQLIGTGHKGTGNAAGGNYISSLNGGNTLVGSAKGNDTFTVAHSNDVVVVAAGAVNDTVDAYSSFSLSANIQNLVGRGGSALTLHGNSMANVIAANSGADTLAGGGGADSFVMAPGQKLETITDFSASGGDKVDITAYQAKGLNPSFHDFGTYSTVTFSDGDTIKLLGVHSADLHVSGHFVV
ncbi:MAG TPA: heparin lyase I family protein [Caulobacteraceae bacterium]|jgi:Ca2+-binding RTX toxin-like protein